MRELARCSAEDWLIYRLATQKSELNSAREERKRLPGQIEAYEKEGVFARRPLQPAPRC